MPTIFDNAFEALADAQEAFAGAPITYVAITGEEIEIDLAVQGKVPNRLGKQVEQVAVQHQATTWVFRASLLVDADDQPIVPRIGDRIHADDAEGVAQRYDVVRPGTPDGPIFDWLDNRTRVRVYAVRIGPVEE